VLAEHTYASAACRVDAILRDEAARKALRSVA
jgi:hypothetical protein